MLCAGLSLRAWGAMAPVEGEGATSSMTAEPCLCRSMWVRVIVIPGSGFTKGATVVRGIGTPSFLRVPVSGCVESYFLLRSSELPRSYLRVARATKSGKEKVRALVRRLPGPWLCDPGKGAWLGVGTGALVGAAVERLPSCAA